jgi:hypothetical protein
LALQSQTFQTTWTTLEASISADVVATTAPDGTNTADKLVESVANDEHRVTQSITKAASATTYTVSVFAKSTERNLQFGIDSGTAANIGQAIFNLTNGTVGSATVAGTFTSASASIQALPNGWYRCSVTATTGTETTVRIRIRLVSGASTTTYAGDGTSGIFLWQAQLETGSVATSPIVTTAGTASRVADVVSLTGASSLIGQTGGGTLYIEVDWRSSNANAHLLGVSDGTDANRIQIYAPTSISQLNMFAVSNNVGITDQGQSYVGYSGIQKIAFGYAQNDAVLYRNGSSISADALFDISALATLTKVNIGSRHNDVNQANMWIRSVALFPTRLANATLASLTA